MSSAYFDPAVGGNGTTVTDDTNPTTGLDAYGWRARFVPCLMQVVAIAQWVLSTANTVLTNANAAAANAIAAASSATAAAAAVSGAGFIGTSSTSQAIATGSLTFTIAESTRAWAIGSYLKVNLTGDTSKYMTGTVSSYSGSSLTISIDTAVGSGTYSAWTIAPAISSGSIAITGINPGMATASQIIAVNAAGTAIVGTLNTADTQRAIRRARQAFFR